VLNLKTVLNHAQPIPGFVYEQAEFLAVGENARIDVKIRAHGQIRPKCSECHRACPGYDRLSGRHWTQVPLWTIRCHYHYAPRRVNCPEHGIVVEHMPWNVGKHPLTLGMMAFLSMWARRMSWLETARAFKVSWESVFRSVEWTVKWGLKHRVLEGVKALGIDDLHWGRAGFLTLIYQIDEGTRRLLWIGQNRTQATLMAGLDTLGPEVVSGVEYVCSDMWRPYLNVIRKRIAQALHVLDRFHITAHLNGAVDEVRRGEMSRLKAAGKTDAAKLNKMRWNLLKKRSRVLGRARQRLNTLIFSKLATARAWLLKDSFQHFWTYRSVSCATRFLDAWCQRAIRSRLPPMKKVARMLRRHQPLIMNWFRAKGALSSGAVEGLNNKIRVTTRRAYGFRTFKALEVALYHSLGKLPEPPPTHRFC
jgi:transposase